MNHPVHLLSGLLLACSLGLAPACGSQTSSPPPPGSGDDDRGDTGDDDGLDDDRDEDGPSAMRDSGTGRMDAGRRDGGVRGPACDLDPCEQQIAEFEARMPAFAGAAGACCVDEDTCGMSIQFPGAPMNCIDPAAIASRIPGLRDGGRGDAGRSDASTDAGRLDAGRSDAGGSGGQVVQLDDGGVVVLTSECPDLATSFGVSLPGCCRQSDKQCGLSSHSVPVPGIPKACQDYESVRSAGLTVDLSDKTCSAAP